MNAGSALRGGAIGWRVRLVDREDLGDRVALIAGLADVLIDCVEGGASASFMAPLERDRAEGHWSGVLDAAVAGTRMLLVAEDEASGTVVGTVQVVPAAEENQPHRGDITKLLVHRRARRRGLAEALMAAAEEAALAAGLTLLVLDTASAEATRVYERRGWQRVGTIPGFALWPDGGLCDTTFFCKQLVPPPAGDLGSADHPPA